MLAAALRAHVARPGAAVLDVCTGSGMLAVQAALLGARVTAVDVTRRALVSARVNALLNGVRVHTRRGSLFSALDGERFDTIVSNPPYVPAAGDALPAHGPRRAWDAGRDGRALLDPLCRQVADHLRPGGTVLLVHSAVCSARSTSWRRRGWTPTSSRAGAARSVLSCASAWRICGPPVAWKRACWRKRSSSCAGCSPARPRGA